MRTAGISIDILVDYVSLFKKGKSTRGKRKQLLIDQRKDLARRIAEMQQMLERLDQKIESYENDLYHIEHKLGQTEQ
jgi:DNA-binding transcriptional MerR regulator